MYFPLHNEDHAKWTSYHGVRVFKTETGEWKGMLPNKCQFLTEDGKCAVYGTNKRPQMCEDFWCDLATPMKEVFFEPKITVITPSIRPDGLKMVFETLQKQTFQGFQWLPRLSLPGEKSDLCKQMNAALAEAQAPVIVFLQDYIEIPEDALEKIYNMGIKSGEAWTFPLVKGGKEDWRFHREKGSETEYNEWEIDFGACATEDLRNIDGFFERYDEGFGWENVDAAYLMHKEGVKFYCNPEIVALGVDHDAQIDHPYKKTPNQSLWETRKKTIDLMYASESEDLESTS